MRYTKRATIGLLALILSVTAWASVLPVDLTQTVSEQTTTITRMGRFTTIRSGGETVTCTTTGQFTTCR